MRKINTAAKPVFSWVCREVLEKIIFEANRTVQIMGHLKENKD
jgi:hypothetical protein